MIPIFPIPPICPLNAEVPGNILWQPWEGMGEMRGMGNIPPMTPISPMPPIRPRSAEVLGNVKARL